MSGAAQAVALIPPVMAPTRGGDIQEARADSPLSPFSGLSALTRSGLDVDGPPAACVVEDYKEANRRAGRTARLIIAIPNIGTLYMDEKPSLARLPGSKIYLILNRRPILCDHCHGEEVSVPALLALAVREVRDDSRKLFG